MIDVGALHRRFDPLRSLSAAESDLYVDWQAAVAPSRQTVHEALVDAFERVARPERPIVRLLTGHLGTGKTTELDRVAHQLSSPDAGRRIFVSRFSASEWLDLEDVQHEDLIFQIIRQLVVDLERNGMGMGVEGFETHLAPLWDALPSTAPETERIRADPLRLSFALKDFSAPRDAFRAALREMLPMMFDLCNDRLLPAARKHLAQHGGYADLLIIVDGLGGIPGKDPHHGGSTNQQQLFIEHAPRLRAISCNLLLTIPVELAHSPARDTLEDVYSTPVITVPVVPISDQDGNPLEAGERALIEILDRRAGGAAASLAAEAPNSVDMIFETPDLLRRVVRLSGGHLRSLLLMVTELLDWVEDLPITAAAVDRWTADAAANLERGLVPGDWDVLERVRRDHRAVPDDARFYDLLRDQYVYAREIGASATWYAVNPLLCARGHAAASTITNRTLAAAAAPRAS